MLPCRPSRLSIVNEKIALIVQINARFVLYVYIGLSTVILLIVPINAQLWMYRIVYNKSKYFVLTIPFNVQFVMQNTFLLWLDAVI